MKIGNADFSMRNLFRRPLSDTVGYVLTAVIVVLVWTFGVVLTAIDFGSVSLLGSGSINMKKAKESVQEYAAQIDSAVQIQSMQKEYSFKAMSISGVEVTQCGVSGKLKGGNVDGFYYAGEIRQYGDGDNLQSEALLLYIVETEEQGQNAVKVITDDMKREQSHAEGKDDYTSDPECAAMFDDLYTTDGISDVRTELTQEYETCEEQGIWVNAKDVFVFLTKTDCLSPNDSSSTEYRVACVHYDGYYYERLPKVDVVVASQTNEDRQTKWNEYLASYKDSMEKMKEEGFYRF